jgi:D-3-phosphoglycerate dehydrogenase
MAHVIDPAVAIENKALVLDLLEWVAARPRTYAEVMDAWRTSCPRLPVWEDANELRFVARTPGNGAGPTVEVTAAGAAFLAAERPASG